MSQFRVKIAADGHAVVGAAGEVDLANAGQLLEAGNDAFAMAAVEVVVIDLGAVTFMDSSALSALISLRNCALRTGKQLRLSQVPDRVGQLLAITQLAGVFAIDEQVGDHESSSS